MPQHDTPGGKRDGERRLDIILLPFGRRRAMGGAGEIGVLGEDQGEDQLVAALAENGGDDEGKQDGREG